LNFMDAFFGAVMILFMNITAFCVKDTHLEVLGWVCVAMVLVALALLAALLVLALLRRCGKLTKPFSFFLCHCKAEAGAFARWLKLELVNNPQVKQEVFLDSDNLESLDCLLGYVAQDVQTLVVIASRTVFYRPWCVGEMTTAHGAVVHSIVLEMADYEPLTAGQIETYETLVPDLEGLCVDNGIALQAVRAALSAFSMKERIGVPALLAAPGMAVLGKMLVAGTPSGNLASAPKAPKIMPHVGILRDRTIEANAIAFVLQRLMVRYTCFGETGPPEVLCMEDDEPIPTTVKKALLLCTQGCFAEFLFLTRVCELSDRNAHILPVIGDDEFRVPRPEVFKTLRTSQIKGFSNGAGRQQEMVARAVAIIFKEIAVPFKAKMDRYTALDSAASRAAKRLLDPPYRREGSGMGHLNSVNTTGRDSWADITDGDGPEKLEGGGFHELEDAELMLEDSFGLDISSGPRPFRDHLDAWAAGIGRQRV